MVNPTLNNPYNRVLEMRRHALASAQRVALTPLCNPTTVHTAATLSTRKRRQLLSVPINAFTAGDNQLIPTLTGKKLIHEIFLWNVTTQTLGLFQGPSATGILLFRMTTFPGGTGFILGFNGSFEMPHFEIDSGQPLILNLQNSTQVDGFIRYRIPGGADQ